MNKLLFTISLCIAMSITAIAIAADTYSNNTTKNIYGNHGRYGMQPPKDGYGNHGRYGMQPPKDGYGNHGRYGMQPPKNGYGNKKPTYGIHSPAQKFNNQTPRRININTTNK